jgi:polar amino acid transport system substrate-binding protein
MKRFLLLLLTFLLTGSVSAESIKVTIYTDDSLQPYSYKENGEVKGTYVNIIKTVFDRMKGYDVKITAVPWKRGKKLMETGKGFGLATAYFHGHDWPYLYPYSLPLASDVLNVYCTSETLQNQRLEWPGDYQQLRIGRPSGFSGWGGPKFDEMVKAKKITLEESKGSVTQILKLGAGRVDCIIMDQTTYNVEYNKAVSNGKFNSSWKEPVLGVEISRNEVYIGYSKIAIESGKYPFHMDFRQQFDSELFKMIRSGERDKILNAN